MKPSAAPAARRDIRRVRSLFLFAFVFLLASTPRAQGSAVRTETFSLKPGGEIVVENARGATRVESWDYQTVRVLAEKRAPGSSIEPGELVLMGAQNSVIVQTRQGSDRIDLTLYVPHGAQLQVTGGSWPVDVGGVLSSVIVDTTSGNIAYRIPSNDDANIAISSALGTVRSTIALAAVERTGTRSLRGRMGNGTAQIILNSQSGSVVLAPAPNSAAVARVFSRQPAAPLTGMESSSGAGAPRSEVESRRASSSSSSVNRDSVQPNEPVERDAISSRQTVQSNGSVVFAGNDRSVDSSSITTSGPFVRPRRERNTSAGGSGLKVRVIPSKSPPRSSQDAAGAANDQANDADYASGSNPSSTGSSTAPGTSNSGGGNSSTGGSIDFAGNDRANVGTSKSRVGPLERDRQQRTTGGGNSGLRVRIIPSNPSPSRTSDSSPIYDQRDANSQQSWPVDSSTNRAPQTSSDQAARSNGYAQPRANPTVARPAESADVQPAFDRIASADSRENAPPVLRRNIGDESSSTSAPGDADTKARGADEEAVVLKAALVSLNVSVTNRAGVALANLRKEEFEVAENGEPQKIEFFQPTTAPFNLVLVLDLSGSIKDKLDVVRSAALRFLDVLGPQDKVAVVTFTDEIRVVSQLTDDRNELKRRIRAIDQSRGGTAFYEALWFSLADTLRGTRGQRNAIVVMSDGVDSSLDRYNPMESRVSFNQLAHRLEEADVIVFPIYLDTEYEEVFERGNSSSEAYAIARDQLERIAEVSGGQMFKAEKVGDLAGVYKQVAAAMRTVYSVGYYPTNAEKDGTFRRVRVLVDRPDAAVRARKGYYAR
jgi:VWFA-related protein